MRYSPAVELAPGDREAQLVACGRSEPAREALRYLAALGRPASVSEVQRETEPLRRSSSDWRGRDSSGSSRSPSASARPPPHERSDPPELRAPFGSAGGCLQLDAALAAGAFASFLLAGMTGAGRPSLPAGCCKQHSARGRSTILLVPRSRWCRPWRATRGNASATTLPSCISGLGTAERQQEWERVRSGGAPRGARPALRALRSGRESGPDRGRRRARHVVQAGDRAALSRTRSRAGARASRGRSRHPGLGDPEPRDALQRGARQAHRGPSHDKSGAGRAARGHPGGPSGREARQGRRGAFFGTPDRRARRRAHRRSAVDSAAQPSRLLAHAALPRLRRGSALPGLRLAAHVPPQGAPPHLSLLRCRRAGAAVCPTCSTDALEPIGAGTERVEEQFRELFLVSPSGSRPRHRAGQGQRVPPCSNASLAARCGS